MKLKSNQQKDNTFLKDGLCTKEYYSNLLKIETILSTYKMLNENINIEDSDVLFKERMSYMEFHYNYKEAMNKNINKIIEPFVKDFMFNSISFHYKNKDGMRMDNVNIESSTDNGYLIANGVKIKILDINSII